MSATGEEKRLTDIEMLDVLINQHYQELSGKVDVNNIKNVKIGDLIKMIEARRKLAPGDGDQKEFWKMLDEIRRRKFQPSKAQGETPTHKKARSKKRSRKISAGNKARAK